MLDTAVRLYTTLPYEEVTVRRICGELKINLTTFYRYFGAKEDFYFYAYRTLQERMEIKDTSNWEMTDYLIQNEEMDDLYTPEERKFLLLWQQMPDTIVQEMVFDEKERQYSFINTREAVEREMAAGRMRPDLRPEIASYIFDKFPYLVYRYAQERGITDPEEIDELKHYVAYDFLAYGFRGKKPGEDVGREAEAGGIKEGHT